MRAKRALGQNFLVDEVYQRRIADAVDAGPDDTVLEIGPGTGAITTHLAERAGKLLAVEIDASLKPRLEAKFGDRPNVTIVIADFLDLEPADLVPDGAAVKVVGNIPYYITTPIIFRLLERGWRPAEITLMVQQEVADRILAAPAQKAYGALSVGVRTVADATRLFHVPRGAFRPIPNVDSTVIRITPLRPPPLTAEQEADLRSLTRAAFGWRRKQLRRILRSADPYLLTEGDIEAVTRATGIEPSARPEMLTPAQFVRLSAKLRELGRPTSHATPEVEP